MARTAIATFQTAPDCRWSRLGHRLNGVAEAKQPETTWVCVREGVRRDLRDDECAECPHWELDDAGSDIAVSRPPEAGVLSASAVSEPAVGHTVRTWRLVGGICFGIAAATLFVTAMLIVTESLAVGFAIAAWLGTAAIVGVVANDLRSNG
jgi:hypothetical protein